MSTTDLAAVDCERAQSRLRRSSESAIVPLLAVIAAFGTYFCMYAFRKPFTVASYADLTLWGIGYKTLLVSTQVVGYTISKFIGIRVIAEMLPHRRAITLLALIAVAQIALVAFAIVPVPYNWVCLFFNGLPLGMVYGLVLGFLEGRRLTEALVAGLCASFILADGVVKSVGAWLIASGVGQFWMPAATGAIFALPLLGFVWLLARTPPPTEADAAERAARVPLSKRERWALFTRYAPGLTTITGMFLLVTILRSFRADFMPEIWRDLGVTAVPALFAQAEFWVAVGVTIVNGGAAVLRSNRAAFHLSMAISLGGIVLLALALVGQSSRSIAPFWFMVLCGIGLYLPYVAVHTTIFERLIAMTREPGNLGFLMYVADAFGYLGYVAIMLLPTLFSKPAHALSTFQFISWVGAIASAVLIVVSWCYFSWRVPRPAVESATPQLATNYT